MLRLKNRILHDVNEPSVTALSVLDLPQLYAVAGQSFLIDAAKKALNLPPFVLRSGTMGMHGACKYFVRGSKDDKKYCAQWVDVVQPTLEELRMAAVMPSRPADADGCLSVDVESMHRSLQSASVLQRWSRKLRANLSAAGGDAWVEPMDFLADVSFGSPSPTPAVDDGLDISSTWTRLVFTDFPESAHGNRLAQRAIDGEALASGTYSYIDVASGDTVELLSLSWRQWHLFKKIAQSTLLQDILWATGSASFVFLFTWSQSQSLTLTSFGLLSILVSFPASYIIYRLVLGLRWFGVLNFIGLFVIMGIGADDVYVLLDHWNARKAAKPDEGAAERAAHVIYEGATSISATSLTTAVAFLGNIGSKIMPLRAFGALMATLVGCTFVAVFAVIPAALVVRDRALDLMSAKTILPVTSRSLPHQTETEPTKFACRWIWWGRRKCRLELPTRAPQVTCNSMTTTTATTSSSLSTRSSQQRSRLNAFIEACVVRLADMVMNRRFFFSALLPAVLLIAFMSVSISSVTERATVWPSWHNEYRYFMDERNYPAGLQKDSVNVRFIFGIEAVDSGDRANPKSWGKGVVFDEDFDYAGPESQLWFKNLCSDLRRLQREGHVIAGSIVCAPESFEHWLKQKKNLELPIGSRELYKELFAEYLSTDEGQRIGGVYRSHDSEEPVKLMSISVVAPVLWSESPSRLREEWIFWEDFMRVHTSGEAAPNANGKGQPVPPGLEGGFQTATPWVWMSTEEELQSTSTQSLMYGLVLATVVLYLCTRSVTVTLLASGCLVSVVATFLMFMSVFGWQLGVIECVCITVVVGLSVDYTVHVATAYVRSTLPSRVERARAAILSMGRPVLCGAVSTIGASVFLDMCVLIVFPKFGAFVLVTMGSSLFHAIFVFPALCAVFGPDSRVGQQPGDHTAGQSALIVSGSTVHYISDSDSDDDAGKENRAGVLSAANPNDQKRTCAAGIEMATIANGSGHVHASSWTRGPVTRGSSAHIFVPCTMEKFLPAAAGATQKPLAVEIPTTSSSYSVIECEETETETETEWFSDDEGIEMTTIAQDPSTSSRGPVARSTSAGSGSSTTSFVACRIEDITVVVEEKKKTPTPTVTAPPTIYSIVHHDDADENTDLDDEDIDDEEVTLLSRYDTH